MYFSEKSIKDMRERFNLLPQRVDELIAMYANRQYRNDEARQFAIYGFVRRVQILRHTIEEVFYKLPPDSDAVPEIEPRTAALVNMHAFTMSAFAAVDNLAWVWVKEKNIRYPDGTTIRMHHIGLGPKNTYIRGTLSAGFQQHLRTLKKWFKYLERLRHALAHRMPYYIPPFSILTTDEVRHQELFTLRQRAVGNPPQYEALTAEQKSLEFFQPVLRNDYQSVDIIVFHPQMLADFDVIEDLGRRMFAELDRDVIEPTPISRWKSWLLEKRREWCARICRD